MVFCFIKNYLHTNWNVVFPDQTLFSCLFLLSWLLHGNLIARLLCNYLVLFVKQYIFFLYDTNLASSIQIYYYRHYIYGASIGCSPNKIKEIQEGNRVSFSPVLTLWIGGYFGRSHMEAILLYLRIWRNHSERSVRIIITVR